MKASEIVELVDKIRLKKCLSMEKISKLLGINILTYIKIVTKKNNPSMMTLGKLINLLHDEGYEVELER